MTSQTSLAKERIIRALFRGNQMTSQTSSAKEKAIEYFMQQEVGLLDEGEKPEYPLQLNEALDIAISQTRADTLKKVREWLVIQNKYFVWGDRINIEDFDNHFKEDIK